MKSLRNVRARLVLAAALLLLTLGSWTAAYGQLTPSDDAYVNSAKTTTNFGATSTLNLQSAADTSFIRFDLSAVPTGYTGSSITKATLKLYVNSVATAGSFNVNYVNGAWAETTITYSLQPAIGTTIAASVPLATANKGKYVEIDITAAMVEWLNGTQANDGIALVANSPLVATFDSKENTGASHAAEIDIVYAGIAGVTTANGSGLMGGGTSGTLKLALTNSCAANQVLQWNGSSWACATAGTGTITGVTAGTDLTGGGNSGTVKLNLDTTKVPQLNTANSFSGNQSVTGNVSATSFSGNGSSLTNVNAAQLGGQPASYYATQTGFNDFTNSQAFYGNNLFMYTGDPGCGYGYAGIGFGALSGCIYYAVAGDSVGNLFLNTWPGGSIYFGEGGQAQMRLLPGGTLVSQAQYGQYSGVGVKGVSGSASNTGLGESNNGLWGDSGSGGTGVVGTADDSTAGAFWNNSPNKAFTLEAYSMNAAAFPFVAGNTATNKGCNIDPSGNLNCDGAKHAVVPIDGGQRKVALSAIESPKNWFEDFGSAQLSAGVATVALEPDFAQTVNTGVEYHVFLSPNGDCKGLYVSQKTGSSFEVHELGGGASSVSFDYRIVALRKNFENIRLEDHTKDSDPAKLLEARKKGAPVKLDMKQLMSPPKPAPNTHPIVQKTGK